MIPKHVHDRFFKEAFSRPDVVTDFIQAYLPLEFGNQLNFSTLARLQDSHVDEDLSQYYVDLLFSIVYGEREIQLALLFEHKSYLEEYPHFQLNQYLLNYWRDQLKEQKPYAKLTAGLLKTVRQKQQLTNMLDQLRQVINDLVEEQAGEQFVKTAFIYIHWASKLTSTEIIGIFRSISQKTETTAMSAAETLIKQGMQQGMEQGMQQGEYQVTLKYVKNMLRLGMDAKTIAKAFELPIKTVELYIATVQQK